MSDPEPEHEDEPDTEPSPPNLSEEAIAAVRAALPEDEEASDEEIAAFLAARGADLSGERP